MLRSCLRSPASFRSCSSLVNSQSIPHNTNVILSEFRSEKRSFIKDLFRGHFDRIITYPDVLPNDVYFKLMEDINQEVNDASNVPPSIQNRCVTEKAALWGALSRPDNLSKTESMFAALHYVKEPLEAFGSPELKKKYLNSISDNNLKLGLCLFDEGVDFNSSDVNLVAHNQDDSFVLKGSKRHVLIDGPKADAYLVFAHEMNKSRVNVFLIPSDAAGISVTPSKGIVGHEGQTFVNLNFDNVVVSKDCLLSGEKSNEVLESGVHSSDLKIYRASRVVNILRNLLDHAIHHVHHSYLSDSPRCDFRLVRNKVSQCASKIYALESMIYMTAGLADFQKTPDYKLDAISIELYTDRVLGEVLKEIFDVLGRRGLQTNELFHSSSRQLLASSLTGDNNHFLKIYLGSKAIETVSEGPAEVRKLIDILKIYANIKRIRNKQKWNLYPYMRLKEKVHPSFEVCANKVENAILQLHGTIIKADMDKETNEDELLLRLGEAGFLVHSMFCSLIRGSRAYCIGLQHYDLNKWLCESFIYETDQTLEKLLRTEDNVPPQPYVDSITKVLAECNEFVSSHPLDRK